MKKHFDVAYYKCDQHTQGKRVLRRVAEEDWVKEDIFCPGCGGKEVWRCDDGGDYYVGEQYLCTSCKKTFYLPSGIVGAVGEQNRQRLIYLGEV